MTERKINSAIKKSQRCCKEGYYLEGLLSMYHLNSNLLVFIATRLNVIEANGSSKPTKLIEQLIEEIDQRPELKSVVAKKNLKSLRPWFIKMDDFFKLLKRREPVNAKSLHGDSEQVLAILKIATTKLLIGQA
ncbi:MAG: hypothetical protein ACXVC7_13785 [Bacteroidia bacterium]